MANPVCRFCGRIFDSPKLVSPEDIAKDVHAHYRDGHGVYADYWRVLESMKRLAVND